MIRIDTNIKNRKKDLCCVEKKTRYQHKEREEEYSDQFFWLASRWKNNDTNIKNGKKNLSSSFCWHRNNICIEKKHDANI